MDRARLPFIDRRRPVRSGVLAVDEAGRVTLRVSAELGAALENALRAPDADVPPFRFNDRARGLALIAELVRGIPATAIDCELVSGAFELRAHVGGPTRLTLEPGDFDPDRAWEFILAVNEAKLEAVRP